MRRNLAALALTGILALAGVGAASASKPRTLDTPRHAITQTINRELRAPSDRAPILMYHHIGEREDRYTVSPQRLRAHIDELCTGGYTFQTFRDYARGTRTGRPPAVLTFDDSTRDQFNILADGRIDPSSAVGVLESARRDHPSCDVTATFFVNATTQRGLPAFEQPGLEGKKLQWLYRHGYEVGAHGTEHKDFRTLTPREARADTRRFSQWLENVAPGVPVESFAYPYGSIPTREVQREVDQTFPYTAHAWGGVAQTGTVRLVPRIETGPRTALAQYATIKPHTRVLRVSTPIPALDAKRDARAVVASAPARISPLVRFAPPLSELHGNAYKWSAVRASYARNDPQLPPQPARLLWRPDDRRRGWRGEPRGSREARGQEGRVLDGQEADQWRSALGARELWRPARPVRNRYAWSGYRFSRRDPVKILPQATYWPYQGTLARSGEGPRPLPTPVASLVPTAPVVPWYDQEITHGPVSAVLERRSSRSWWSFLQ